MGKQVTVSGDEVIVEQAVVPTQLTEKDAIKIAYNTKALLDAQPKRKIRMRAISKDKPGEETVQINGWTYTIMRGVEVEVPQSVYEIMDEAGLI